MSVFNTWCGVYWFLILFFVLVGYVIHDARNPAPVSALPADHAQEPARDRTPITRDVQMDSDGEEPGKSGHVVKDGASASNTDMVC